MSLNLNEKATELLGLIRKLGYSQSGKKSESVESQTDILKLFLIDTIKEAFKDAAEY